MNIIEQAEREIAIFDRPSADTSLVLIEELKKVIAERDALQARLDKGVRVYATNGMIGGIWADTVNNPNGKNATLILDEGVSL